MGSQPLFSYQISCEPHSAAAGGVDHRILLGILRPSAGVRTHLFLPPILLPWIQVCFQLMRLPLLFQEKYGVLQFELVLFGSYVVRSIGTDHFSQETS